MDLSSNASSRPSESRHRRGEQNADERGKPSTTRALQAIVRRILRTQSQRTQLEKMVCREARRIVSGGFGNLPRETVVGLIVETLQHQLRGRAIAGLVTGADSSRFAGSQTIAVNRGQPR